LQLIAIRTKRLGPNAPDTSSAKQAQPELDLRGSDGGVLDNEAAAASSAEDDSQPEINRVDWVYKFVCESGSRGVKPTDVLAAASRAKITMHKNYPYVVLRKLVERGKVVKKRGRYYPAT
jgi:hypothetical protein